LIDTMKTKVRNLVPASASLGEFAFAYAPVAKARLDDASIKLFASKTDKELLTLSTRLASALIVRPIQLKRNRPLIPITTGNYTPFARRMQTLAVLVAAPMLSLAVYEIARRSAEAPEEKHEREKELLLSRITV
jgi:hypothetical protein